MIAFAAIVPHPPLLLPSVGSEEDRKKVRKTLSALDSLAGRFKKAKPDIIVISSPHQDWGFEVPLYFLAGGFKGKVETFMTGFQSPREHFEKGRKFFEKLPKNKRYAFIASGDLSHCLKKEGSYGFHSDGPKFNRAIQEYLTQKNIDDFLKLDDAFPEAGECGLRSFSFILGALEAARADWQPEILSYEDPFGVGYLAAKLL